MDASTGRPVAGAEVVVYEKRIGAARFDLGDLVFEVGSGRSRAGA